MTPQERFDRCLDVVLRFEGGFVNDPHDPGGPTNLGVTQATLARWLGHRVSVDDVRALDRAAVAPIYAAQYWRVTGCDQLAAGVDLMVFDCAINQGPAIAGRFLQKAAGVAIDGIVGPATVAAAAACAAVDLVERIAEGRRARYLDTPGFNRFGAGWLRRLEAVAATAHGYAAEAAPDDPNAWSKAVMAGGQAAQ